MAYKFTVNWFERFIPTWSEMIQARKPKTMLELGSYEGRSACFMVERASQYSPGIELTCVDEWADHPGYPVPMADAEARFDHNIAFATKDRDATVRKIKSKTVPALANLIIGGEAFDLIYVDASHKAPDVLTDAVMSYQLLKPGGFLVFDDYLIHQEKPDRDINITPKPAVDAFLNIFRKEMEIVQNVPIFQLHTVRRRMPAA